MLIFLSFLCSVQSLSHVQLFVTPWTAAHQAPLSITNSQSLLTLISYPSSQWCHQTMSFYVIPFSHLQFFPAPGSFPISKFFTSNGQSIGVSSSSSVLPMNIQDWFRLGWTGWISLQSKGFSRVFSNTTVQQHQLFFSSYGEQGLLFSFGIWVSHCSVFSCCRAQALEHRGSVGAVPRL